MNGVRERRRLLSRLANEWIHAENDQCPSAAGVSYHLLSLRIALWYEHMTGITDKMLNKLGIRKFNMIIHTTWRYILCHLTFACIKSTRGFSANTSGWRSMRPSFSSSTVSILDTHVWRGVLNLGGKANCLEVINGRGGLRIAGIEVVSSESKANGCTLMF